MAGGIALCVYAVTDVGEDTAGGEAARVEGVETETEGPDTGGGGAVRKPEGGAVAIPIPEGDAVEIPEGGAVGIPVGGAVCIPEGGSAAPCGGQWRAILSSLSASDGSAIICHNTEGGGVGYYVDIDIDI